MIRFVFGLMLAGSLGVLGVGNAVAKDARTIRIVPHAVYGATISIEAGVRVVRPLPATTHVIVNPNRTPVKISIKEVNKRITHNHHYDPDGRIVSRGGYAIGGYIPYRKKARRDRRKRDVVGLGFHRGKKFGRGYGRRRR